MTAFDNTLPEHSLHPYEADEGGRPASDVSWPSFPRKCLLDAQKYLDSCERSCNQEACNSVEEKETSSGCPVVCCGCSEWLPGVLMPKQEALCFLERELEQERTAAETAANEAISMILRLQVEKAALQMEARHYQQTLEAKTLYDEEIICQLQAIISSQEADRLVLGQEIDECKEALQKYSDIVTKKGCAGCEEFSKGCMICSMAPTLAQKTICEMPSRGSGSLRPLSLEEKFDHVAMQTIEDAQQLDWPSLDTKDEAKTMYVTSMKASNPTLTCMTSGDYLRMQDCQNETLELEGGKVEMQGNCLDDVVKDCWLSILMQFSELYKQISKVEALGSSSFDGECRLSQYVSLRSRSAEMQPKVPVDCAEYANMDDYALDAFQKDENKFSPKPTYQNLNCKFGIIGNGKLSNQQGKVGNAQVHVPMSSWCDMMAKMDGCMINLAEKFATCKSRFHALEATRVAMTNTVEIMKENKWKSDKVLMIVADLMRLNDSSHNDYENSR